MAITAAFLSWLVTAAAGLWFISQIAASTKANGEKLEHLAKTFDDHADDFDKHKSDGSVHTTFEWRQSMQGRLDRIADDVREGHSRIEAKIDRQSDRIMGKQ